MAIRSDQIKIFLSTIGAAKARREIDQLADSMDRLSDAENKRTASTKEQIKADEARAKLINAETRARNAQIKAEHEMTQQQKADARERIQLANAEAREKASQDKVERARLAKETTVYREGERTKRNESNLTARTEARNRADTARNVKAYITSVGKQQAILRKMNNDYIKGIKDTEKAVKEFDRIDEARHRSQLRRFRELGREQDKALAKMKRAFGFRGPHGYALLIGLLITMLPMIATAANAAAAGILALANGFINLSGVLGAVPAGILAGAQAIAIFTMAFKGLGKAMTDQNAFALLGPQAQNLVLAINDLRRPFDDLRNNVRETLLNGIGRDILRLGNYYLPMLNTQLAETARRANTGLRNFTGWLGSGEGRSTVTGIARSNAVVIGNGVDAGQRLLQVFLMVANAAGPMLRAMSSDLVMATHRLDNWVFNNQGGIAAFFMRGYNMFKGALSTISDYGHGLYNIIKLSSPLTDHILNAIEKTGVNFREWTSGAGIPKIKQYFKDMQPDLDMLAHLAGSVAKAIFSMGNNKGFQDFVKVLADQTVPAVADALNKIASSGALSALANVIAMIAHVIDLLATAFGALPKFMQQALVYAIAIASVFRGITFFTGLKAYLGAGLARGAIVSGAGGGTAGGVAAGAAGGTLARYGLGAGAATTGFASLLGPIAIAAGLATGAGSLVHGALASSGNNDRGAAALGRAASSDDLNKFFTTKNGRSIINSYTLGGVLPGEANINSLTSGLQQYKNTLGWRGRGNTAIMHALGMESNQDKIIKPFKVLDSSLTDLAKTGHAAQVAADFEEIRKKAQIVGLTMQQLNALFPQYISWLNQQKSSLGTPGATGTNTPPRTYMDSSGKTHRLAGVDSRGRPYGGGAFFAGGIAPAGFMSLAGEFGPELAMTRGGGLSLLGLNGPQLFNPSSDTAIIPASATSDPFGGSYGNAPEWAKNALQDAVNAPMQRRVAPRSYGGSEAPVTYTASISLGGTQLSEAEITAAVMNGLKKAERDRKERR